MVTVKMSNKKKKCRMTLDTDTDEILTGEVVKYLVS